MTVPVDPPSQATRSAEDAIAALIAARRRRLARCEVECSMVIRFLRRKWFFAANAFLFPQKSARTLGASTSGQHTRIFDSTTPPVHRTHRASTAGSARGVFLPISLERVAARARESLASRTGDAARSNSRPIRAQSTRRFGGLAVDNRPASATGVSPNELQIDMFRRRASHSLGLFARTSRNNCEDDSKNIG